MELVNTNEDKVLTPMVPKSLMASVITDSINAPKIKNGTIIEIRLINISPRILIYAVFLPRTAPTTIPKIEAKTIFFENDIFFI